MEEEIRNCESCKHAIFCPTWGQWKCVKYAEWQYDVDLMIDCTDYEEEKPEVVAAKPCHCETCMERDPIDEDE